MRSSLKRAGTLCTAVELGTALAACGSSSKKSSSGGLTSTTSSGTPSISASSFTGDFSAMAQLKGLASQGKGLVGVLLPDTTTSARYVTFDAIIVGLLSCAAIGALQGRSSPDWVSRRSS